MLLADKLLCVQLKPYNGVSKLMADSWCVPGGTLEEGEGLLAGLEREMVEETGVKPHIGNLLYIQQFAYSGKDHLEFFFHVTNAADYQTIDLSKTTHGTHEIASIGFMPPANTPILPTFLTTEPVAQKAASNTPPTIFSFL